MNYVVHGKTMENLRSSIDVKLMCNKKYDLKWTSNQAICHKKCLTMI